ncbi:Peptidoglycan-binding lysin domain-containing protein [Artemisia annua]|uniref:Peptidoglycan-binding lysin domain-containing protein n=1 Tax=Artemisia annua TaxID=35608 RepID=A0A2U1LZT3_ARTAN|nr:Peptidoglycan-binding lysin domain-containing protein [Artemisia annua]
MANTKASTFFSLILLLSFVLIISTGESKMAISKRSSNKLTLVCNKIYGTHVEDTCLSIIQDFHLTEVAFNAVNPNLNCNKLFVGEWLCIDGSAI